MKRPTWLPSRKVLCLVPLGGLALFLGFNYLMPSHSPDRLLAEAIQAHGGETSFERTRSGRVKGTGTEVQHHNWPFTWEEAFAAPDRLRRVLVKPNLGKKYTTTQLYRENQCRTYRDGVEAGVQAVKPFELQRWSDVLGQLMEVRQAAKLTYLERASESDAAPGIEAESPVWGTIRLYFHPERKLLVRMHRTHPEQGEAEMRFSDYRKFDGIPLPGTMRMYGNQEFVREWIITEVEFLPRLDPTLFEKP